MTKLSGWLRYWQQKFTDTTFNPHISYFQSFYLSLYINFCDVSGSLINCPLSGVLRATN